nr:MAG TPA: Replication associated protein [Microviridae sp.]
MNNDVIPWVSCFKPVSITDCFGRVQQVGCGSCPACQELKRNSLSNRLALEEHRSKYCSFVTLTYDEFHLPIVDVSSLFSSADNEVVSLMQNYDFNEDFSTFSVVNTEELRNSIISYNKHRAFYKCNYSVNRNVTYQENQIAVLVNRHLQLFIKRFRKYVSQNYNEKIRYYAVGEYGVQSLRPHWHILFFYSSSLLARDFENVLHFGTKSRPIQTPVFLRSLWKFGHIDSKQTDGKAYFYVSSYVNKPANFPYVLELLAPQRAFHSNFLGEISSKEDIKKSFQNRDFSNLGKVNVISWSGEQYTYSIRRSLVGRLLPRYSFSACEDDRVVFRKLTLFADFFVKSRYDRLGSVLILAQHIFNAWYFNKDNEYASLASLCAPQCLACLHSDFNLLSPLCSVLYASKRFVSAADSFGFGLRDYYDIYKSYYVWLDYSRLIDNLSLCELDSNFAYAYYDSIIDFDTFSTSIAFINWSFSVKNKFRSRIKHRQIADRFKFNI